MPEPLGSTATPAAAAPDDGFWGALEALVDAGPAYADPDSQEAGAHGTEPTVQDAAEAIAGKPTETPVGASAVPEPAGSATTTDAGLSTDPTTAGDLALEGIPESGDEQTETGDGKAGSRRGPWRELEAEKVRTADLERQLAEARGETPPAAATPATAATAQPVGDDAFARVSALEFLGMDQPVDEDGKPTGEEPIFVRLDRAAKSKEGIPYADEQALYNELSQRGAMAGKLFGLARQVAWQEITGTLAEPDLGLDEQAVAATGGIPGWKAAYRKALETSLGSQRESETASLRATWDQERASLQEQLAEANKKLVEQNGSNAAMLARARGIHSPVSGGRSAGGAPVVPVGPLTTSDDLTSQLAGVFAEQASMAGR